jgi:hypothetical protein
MKNKNPRTRMDRIYMINKINNDSAIFFDTLLTFGSNPVNPVNPVHWSLGFRFYRRSSAFPSTSSGQASAGGEPPV